MKPKNRNWAVGALLFVVLALAGCAERDTTGLPFAAASTDPVVFDDDFGDAVDFQAFLGSKTDAVDIDTENPRSGTASLKVTVPGPGAVDGTYAGGAFTTFNVRDLRGYNALTFYAKASMDAALDVAGLGNDNTGTSLYTAERHAIPLTTEWQWVIIPIPLPERLALEGGLFFFAEGYEQGTGYTIWFDEVLFDSLDFISDPRPALATDTLQVFVGAKADPDSTRVTFDVNGEDVTVTHMPAYFDYLSSNEAVATVSDGVISIVGGGSALITAKLDTIDAAGSIAVTALAPPPTPAPTPTVPAVDVTSLFSEAYLDITVDMWNTFWAWSTAQVEDFTIQGDSVKLYTELNFVGIDFSTVTVDASDMTHLHLDVWAPEGTDFKVKIIARNAAGQYAGEAELAFDGTTTPVFTPGVWSSLEIPLDDFSLAVPRDHLAFLVLSSTDARTVFVDNIYFHK
ncbi:MAG: hypothetical protein JW958_12105 [Candidatus Eisenbacteria bacterium]|nr:hypothetical protein [Candidatus Eisenbacteria bacterium]